MLFVNVLKKNADAELAFLKSYYLYKKLLLYNARNQICVHVNACTCTIPTSTHLLVPKLNLLVIYLLVLQNIANSVPFIT